MVFITRSVCSYRQEFVLTLGSSGRIALRRVIFWTLRRRGWASIALFFAGLWMAARIPERNGARRYPSSVARPPKQICGGWTVLRRVDAASTGKNRAVQIFQPL